MAILYLHNGHVPRLLDAHRKGASLRILGDISIQTGWSPQGLHCGCSALLEIRCCSKKNLSPLSASSLETSQEDSREFQLSLFMV